MYEFAANKFFCEFYLISGCVEDVVKGRDGAFLWLVSSKEWGEVFVCALLC